MQIKIGNLENIKTERQIMDFTEHAGTDGCRHDEIEKNIRDIYEDFEED